MAELQHHTAATITPVLEQIVNIAKNELHVNQTSLPGRPDGAQALLGRFFTAHDETYKIYLAFGNDGFGFLCGWDSTDDGMKRPLPPAKAATHIERSLDGKWDVNGLYNTVIGYIADQHAQKTREETKDRLKRTYL